MGYPKKRIHVYPVPVITDQAIDSQVTSTARGCEGRNLATFAFKYTDNSDAALTDITVIVEESNDGTNWYAVQQLDASTHPTLTQLDASWVRSDPAADDLWSMNVPVSMKQVRCKATGTSSDGSATLEVRLSVASV